MLTHDLAWLSFGVGLLGLSSDAEPPSEPEARSLFDRHKAGGGLGPAQMLTAI